MAAASAGNLPVSISFPLVDGQQRLYALGQLRLRLRHIALCAVVQSIPQQRDNFWSA